MEASVAAGAGQQGGGEAAQGEGQQSGPDIGALSQQLESMSTSQAETRQALQGINDWIASQQQSGEGEGEGEPELDLSFLGDESALMEPEQLQQTLQQTLEQAIEARTQAALGPIQAQLAEQRMEQQARDLVSEFPELGERETAEQVVGLAGEIADQNYPPEIANVLKNSPAFWRQVFLAGRGVEAANQEGSGSPQAAHLEGGGGAAPAGAGQETGSYFGGGDEGGAKLPF